MGRRDYDHIAGCLLGGAVGDALGAPVEFMTLKEIRAVYGSDGIKHYSPVYGRLGAITDDTQMTLFTAEGILRTEMRSVHKGITSAEGVTYYAYLRWLDTQGLRPTNLDPDFAPDVYAGWLYHHQELHHRRAPGNSCLSALASGEFGTMSEPINDSKGCGAVMRMAPVGFVDLRRNSIDPFCVGCELAALTHGHPSGYLAAGFLAQVVSGIMEGFDLPDAIGVARQKLEQRPKSAEVSRAVVAAVELARDPDTTPEAVEQLGAGWVAEEALAISLFCALKAQDFAHGVRLAVNHSGDSDSTGAITGNILGALWGKATIPVEFLKALEMRDVMDELARDFIDCDFSDEYYKKYPGY